MAPAIPQRALQITNATKTASSFNRIELPNTMGSIIHPKINEVALGNKTARANSTQLFSVSSKTRGKGIRIAIKLPTFGMKFNKKDASAKTRAKSMFRYRRIIPMLLAKANDIATCQQPYGSRQALR